MATLSIRPMQAADVSLMVQYWMNCTDEDLSRMGADKTKLPSTEAFSLVLHEICKTPQSDAKSFYLIWLIDGVAVGHSALKDIVHGEIAHMHLHLWNEDYRGKGHGRKLFCLCALEFYKLFKLKLILCEPRASHPMPNSMLSKIGFQKWKTYLSTSSELSETCDLNSYIIDRETAAKAFS
jgi:hypothetical protein